MLHDWIKLVAALYEAGSEMVCMMWKNSPITAADWGRKIEKDNNNRE